MGVHTSFSPYMNLPSIPILHFTDVKRRQGATRATSLQTVPAPLRDRVSPRHFNPQSSVFNSLDGHQPVLRDSPAGARLFAGLRVQTRNGLPTKTPACPAPGREGVYADVGLMQTALNVVLQVLPHLALETNRLIRELPAGWGSGPGGWWWREWPFTS